MNDGAIIPQGNGSVVPAKGKVLNVTSETEGIDVNSLLTQLFQYANFGDALAHIESRMEYIVQIPLKHKEAFEAGKLIINENSKTGVTWPTLYKTLDNGKRQFVDNLPIKQEEIFKGNPFQGIAQSYHSLYLQQQINELAEIMNQTYKVVERIDQGQKDDRIGFLRAGRDQILLSLKLEAEERNANIRSGRDKLLTAQQQILQTFKRRVSLFEPIPKSRWTRFGLELKHSGTLRQRDKDFSEIQEYYSLYLQATQMLAASYAICGQFEQAEQVYEIAEQDMSGISFEAVKTLRYIHEKNDAMLYYHAVEYVTAEKQAFKDDAKEYDYIFFHAKGEKLLEVFKNGGSKEISSSESKQ